MQPDFLDRYSRLDSPIHRLPASLKLTGALALVITVLLVPRFRWELLGVVALFVFLGAGLSRIPWGFLIRRVLLLELFVLGVATMALFQPGGGGLFLFLVAKCTLCLLIMVLLSNTTPFAELLHVLRTARIPALLVTTLSLLYRYLFVLVDEAQRMQRARTCRTFLYQRTWTWHTMATVASQLFIRASERAERIYDAMRARGWR
jgi:cobalt/nickel transport system permease protein